MDNATIRVYSRTNNRWFTARIIPVGGRFGAFSGNSAAVWTESTPGVEFFDATYATDSRFTLGLGQHTGGVYLVSTLLKEDSKGHGLDLMGYVAEWKVDGYAMDVVRAWMTNVASAVDAV